MQNPVSLSALVYRYFFFESLFQDANHGDMWERTAASRYNKAHVHWLITYVRRWCVVCLLTFAMAICCELIFDWQIVSAALYVLCSMCVLYAVIAGTSWMMLRFGGQSGQPGQ